MLSTILLIIIICLIIKTNDTINNSIINATEKIVASTEKIQTNLSAFKNSIENIAKEQYKNLLNAINDISNEEVIIRIDSGNNNINNNLRDMQYNIINKIDENKKIDGKENIIWAGQ